MSLIRNLYYALPPVVRRMARRVYYLPSDTLDAITGRRGPMIPPRGRIFIGSGDFVKTGKDIMVQLTGLAGLKPEHRVLDVGCGIGRVAVPLTAFLNEKGSYEGFDIVKSAINWCNNRISSRYPNFRFTHIDLRNDLYNLSTEERARDFKFPYEDAEFDLVFLTSVFTHMVLDDVENYLDQIFRVLKPGGTCFATFFIINEEASTCMKESGLAWFENKLEHHYLLHARVKEANVAFDEDYLSHQMIRSRGFTDVHLHYGFWSGRQKTELGNFQDICIFKKPRV